MIKLFGTTIQETKNVLTNGIHLGGEQINKDDKVKAIGRVIITVLLIFLATYLFMEKETQAQAGTIIGAVVGYWIK